MNQTLAKLILRAACAGFCLHSGAALAQIECKAIHESVRSHSTIEHKEEVLKVVSSSETQIALEVELAGRNFALRGSPAANEFLVFMTEAPDYTKGVVVAASFNGQNQLRVSSVNGLAVHKLSCTRSAPVRSLETGLRVDSERGLKK